ncbi:GNAT family N-acetyltransferase [Nocardioides piscis]|uniref:GNAT family N-acetyltransferase n=1 Tax=Nocardioides piscis TaxID=2714938 RepID=A0A6G7YDH8_9ACTN|nr:GNAT family N-acetyltransferase [Nocardioides piscis]QIK74830.1 GNAT family N-acetyltransferase [Nocardioides piscis]
MGDDALTVRRLFVEANGEHPMTEADDAYVRAHFEPATAEQLELIAAGRLPLPGYYLSDETPMVADISACLAAAGGVEALHDWFLAFWPGHEETAVDEWATFLAGRYVCLRDLDPLSIRRRTRMLEQARAAVRALRTDPRDEVAQGALAEAVDGGLGVPGLDQLLLPMTAHDRLRFGGPTVRDLWVDAVRAEFHNPQPPALPIRTKRLTLRRARPDDSAATAAAFGDPDFVRHLLVGPQNPAEVAFTAHQRSQPEPPGEHRVLPLLMDLDGTVVGSVVLFFSGAGRTSAEIGWTVYPGWAGRGLAAEAARTLLDVAFEHYGVRRVVANLDAENARSAALAERLGMRRESARVADYWSKGRWTDSYDYAILRAEWEARRHTAP